MVTVVHRAQQATAGAFRVQVEAGLPSAANGLACGIPKHHIRGTQLITDPLQDEPRRGTGYLRDLREGVPLSYQCAKRTARVGRARDKAGRLFSYYDLSFPVLLSALGTGWQEEQLRRPLECLTVADGRGSLRATLVAWFAQDCLAERAAGQLGIHRNTLDYRLRRIGEITGLDLARIDDRLMLYAALQLE